MIEFGKTATLKVMKMVTGGAYLDGENLGEVFVPKRELPAGTAVGDSLSVFCTATPRPCSRAAWPDPRPRSASAPS